MNEPEHLEQAALAIGEAIDAVSMELMRSAVGKYVFKNKVSGEEWNRLVVEAHAARGNVVATLPLPPTKAGPGTVRKAGNFATALAHHIAAGRPKCDQEQIDARLELCQGCELYDATKEVCTHPSCGCNVSRKKRFLNKLAWADQQCPIGKWPRLDGTQEAEASAVRKGAALLTAD